MSYGSFERSLDRHITGNYGEDNIPTEEQEMEEKMDMKEKIGLLISLVRRHTEEVELANDVENWLESPSCPLTEEREYEWQMWCKYRF